MENDVAYMNDKICSYFVETPTPIDATDCKGHKERKASSLIRVHNEKLKDLGEFSFPSSPDIWSLYFPGRRLRNPTFKLFIEDESNKEAKAAKTIFLDAAANWRVPVMNIALKHERCALFLHRNAVTEQLLRQVLLPGAVRYGQLKKQPQQRVQLIETMEEDYEKLSFYRAKVIRETLRRVLEYSEWNVVEVQSKEAADDKEARCETSTEALQLRVVSVAAKTMTMAEGDVTIKCGIVTDPTTRKLAQLSSKEYINLRSNDMHLIAVHKYGVRVKDSRFSLSLMERLGTAAVTVDLLEVKHSSPVKIIRNAHGSTKGASFILYNTARLESLLRAFDKRVQLQNYGQLPALDNVDLSVLNEEEEWQLIFGYIFAFPNLIERCVEQMQQGACATHLIVHFLSGFVALFSVYYRRVRILIDMRKHLMPLIHARIYLVKAVLEILNKTLELLDIEPVKHM